MRRAMLLGMTNSNEITTLVTDLRSQTAEYGDPNEEGVDAIAGWRTEAGSAGDMVLLEMMDRLGDDALEDEWDRQVASAA